MRRKRDYQNKDFKNPYFPKSQKIKLRRFRWFWLILVVLISVGLYFLNSCDKLKISNIEISGNERIAQEEIKNLALDQLTQRRWLFFSQENIFFFNKKEVKQRLLENYFLEEVKIKKKYPNTLELEIKEKISAIIWFSGEDKYYLDLDGVALRKMAGDELVIKSVEGDLDIIRSELSSGEYPVIYDQSSNPVDIGQNVVSKETISFVVDLIDELKVKADFDISHYNIAQPNAKEIILVTKEGWQAYFKVSDEARGQAESLISVLYNKVKNRSSLEYIDLRFGSKVFYQ